MSHHAAEPGVWLTRHGAEFCVFSDDSLAVLLCLYDETGTETCYPMTRRGDLCYLTVPGVGHGQYYGYRLVDELAPSTVNRESTVNPKSTDNPVNPVNASAHWLLDPHARAIVPVPSVMAQAVCADGLTCEPRLISRLVDSSAFAPFVHPKPWRPMAQTILYELHVKGFSMTFPGIPEQHRGRFLAFTEPKVLDYLQHLGVTAVELMPCQQFVSEPFLTEKGLSNYWGYNTIGFFAPHYDYGDMAEFRAMVDALHGRGIEVILDVVYNHTAEGGAKGPVFSFKALANKAYYRLNDDGGYINDTGCGNTLNLNHPRVLELVMDSLRYWSEVGGVDGFRFDLATCLGRTSTGFDVMSGFFAAIGQDPQLKHLKLIAEPWDLGPGGYRLGGFPKPFAEWNDKYRDAIRRLWRGDSAMLGEFARRFHGSAEVFEASQRGPWASVNFITSHDGFTLRDLLSFISRHNEANHEANRDGHRENLSQNLGVEGDAPELDALRQHKARAMLMTLLFSFGVPMLRAGDELWQTQQGNNNAYCQDNPISWIDWENADFQLVDFVRDLIGIRRQLPLLNAEHYIHGRSAKTDPAPGCLLWFNERGEPMADADWQGAAPPARPYVPGVKPEPAAEPEPATKLQSGAEAKSLPKQDTTAELIDTSLDALARFEVKHGSQPQCQPLCQPQCQPHCQPQSQTLANSIDNNGPHGTTALIAVLAGSDDAANYSTRAASDKAASDKAAWDKAASAGLSSSQSEPLLLFVINPGDAPCTLRLPAMSQGSTLQVLCSNLQPDSAYASHIAPHSSSAPAPLLLQRGNLLAGGCDVSLPAFGAVLLQSVQ